MGISLNKDEIDEKDELHVHNSAFKGMRNLRFLNIYTNKSRTKDRLHLLEGFNYLPPKLRLLSWDRYPMRCMPSKFCPKYLVKVKMQGSKLEKLWEGIGVIYITVFFCEREYILLFFLSNENIYYYCSCFLCIFFMTFFSPNV